MTTLASKPDWAPAIWRDNQGHVFVQFGQDVLRFDYSQDALGKILKLIPAVESQPGYVARKGNIADHVLRKPIKLAKKTERERILKSMSPERRAKLQEMIRKANIKENK